MFQRGLVGPFGTKFIRKAKAANRLIFAWTVNEEEWMEWSIKKGLDGVITDDPKLYRDVCDRLEQPNKGKSGNCRPRASIFRLPKLCVEVVVYELVATILFTYMFVTGKFQFGTKIIARNPKALHI
jgi:phosphatidylglycerol phospholipase C